MRMGMRENEGRGEKETLCDLGKHEKKRLDYSFFVLLNFEKKKEIAKKSIENRYNPGM